MSTNHRNRGVWLARKWRTPGLQKVLEPAQAFIQAEGSSGYVLITFAAIALILANTPWSEAYRRFWETPIEVRLGPRTIADDLRHWVNSGLMAFFFFVITLEVKRELLVGALSTWKRAALPVGAAVGGMVAPALIYYALNAGEPTARGWGIPIATDVAFALGVLGLLGKRVGPEVRAFVLTLAVVDDVGAIFVIAIFYAQQVSWLLIGLALLVLAVIAALWRLGIEYATVHAILGVILWGLLFESGVHATLAGVGMASVVPYRALISRQRFVREMRPLTHELEAADSGGTDETEEATLGQIETLTAHTESPLDRIERRMHPWSNFLILPIFALANANVRLSFDLLGEALSNPIALGVTLGFLIGKPAGILGGAAVMEKLGMGDRPKDVSWHEIAGAGVLSGIGFTVALFIATLSFEQPRYLDVAKIGILSASTIAAGAGYFYLRMQGGRERSR